ncbi:hypothetical protein IB229_12305 [Pseudomonas sp. PDM14]|uniref:hypothetical protein n=1 Tax=Pseudomonas sp. PDM14 TaxID=2769288 RepID=UPI00177FEAE2|nr:hypothetical protein [Pseudomonas sp. PDM14]MBD9483761.1 hypothetical protein [Pseudomonas sp. PDM14]
MQHMPTSPALSKPGFTIQIDPKTLEMKVQLKSLLAFYRTPPAHEQTVLATWNSDRQAAGASHQTADDFLTVPQASEFFAHLISLVTPGGRYCDMPLTHAAHSE